MARKATDWDARLACHAPIEIISWTAALADTYKGPWVYHRKHRKHKPTHDQPARDLPAQHEDSVGPRGPELARTPRAVTLVTWEARRSAGHNRGQHDDKTVVPHVPKRLERR